MRDIMQCTDSDTHDDSLQSSPSIESGVSLVMPAATVHTQNFIESPIHDVSSIKDSFQDGSPIVQNAVHAQHVLKLLQFQRQTGFLCDITIHVRDRSFKAHKPLLAACSLYFRSLFADPNSKESTALDLVPLTPAGFEILLDYIYSGHLAITADNCSAVLSAAICLQMTNVEETCKKFMQSSFQMNTSKELPLPGYFADQVFQNVASLKKSGNIKDSLKAYKQNISPLSSNIVSEEEEAESRDEGATLLRIRSVDSAPKHYSSISTTGTSLPSASQLQSVLPILMNNFPRQPTPKEVQNILAAFPNAAEILSKYPMLYASKALAEHQQKYQQDANEGTLPLSSVLNPKSMHLAVSSTGYSYQNGHHSLPKETSRNVDVGSAQNSSTRCSATSHLTATEQGKESKEGHRWKHKTPVHSTTDQPNSIQISSDEEEKAVAELKAPVSKALSLPSLSETPVTIPVARARSAENDNNSFRGVMRSQRSMVDQYVGRKSLFGVGHAESEDKKDDDSLKGYSDTLSPNTEQYVESGSSHASPDEAVNKNFVLDLSTPNLGVSSTLKSSSLGGVRHITLTRHSESEMSGKNSRRSSAASSFSDPGMQLAADALSMLKQSKSKESGFLSDYQANSASGDSSSNEPHDILHEGSVWEEDTGQSSSIGSSKQATFSRKPRRTTGGQTCTWPGCKRLFRHRNIYEEHQRMHEKGIPASQLRKCYMGARVKKTVREQLEEMRTTNDSVFEGVTESEATKYNRARKRKPNSDSQEPLRKRVNVKDRVGNIQFSTAASLSLKETLSNSMRPPTLIPALSASKVYPVVGPDGIVKLVHSGEAAATSTQQSGLAFASSPYSMATSTKSPIAAGISLNRAAISSAHMQGLNPVAATLALFGIQSPLGQNEAGATSPLDQYRQRVSSDAAVQSQPGISAHSAAALAGMAEKSPEALARGLSYQGDATTIKEAVLLTRSLSSSAGVPSSNKTHPN